MRNVHTFVSTLRLLCETKENSENDPLEHIHRASRRRARALIELNITRGIRRIVFNDKKK